MSSHRDKFTEQHFPNDYALVNGVEIHDANPDNFKIPHAVLKKHIGVGHFVELRIDSPRFSVHDDAVENCYCPTCNGEATKPILGHQHPASLLLLPKQNVPSRVESYRRLECVERPRSRLTGRRRACHRT